MKIYTQAGFGDFSSYFRGSKMPIPFCSLGQGSKGVPSSWVQLSSVIVNGYKERGFKVVVRDPITCDISQSIGCLFVDDMDLCAMEEG